MGVGGTPEPFVRAGTLGLPLMVAIIGGEPKRFRPLIDLYREAGRRAGHSDEKLIVGLHAIGFLGNTNERSCGRFLSWVRRCQALGRGHREVAVPPDLLSSLRLAFQISTGSRFS